MAPSSSRKGARVRLVAIHTAEGSRNKESLGAYFNSGVQASSHVGIDPNGEAQYVPYDRASWTLRDGNAVSDNAELCAFAQMTREQWLTDKTITFWHVALKRNVTVDSPLRQLRHAAAWTRRRCLARGIPMVKLSPADVRAGKAGVIGHVDWTNGMNDGSHTDPGKHFPWDVFMAMVRGEQNPQEDDVPDFTPQQAQLIADFARDCYPAIARLDRNANMYDLVTAIAVKLDALAGQLSDDEAKIIAAVRAQPTGGAPSDEQVGELATRLAASLGPTIATELGRRLVAETPS